MKQKLILWIFTALFLINLVYSADLTDADCGRLLSESSVLIEDMTCNDTGVFIIKRDDLTIDCQGHSITYAQNGTGNGIVLNESEGVVIKNCEIIEDVSGNHNYGIYAWYPDVDEGEMPIEFDNARIENNTITTRGLNSYDIGLFNADYIKLYNQPIGRYDIDNSRAKISDGVPGWFVEANVLLVFKNKITEKGDNLSDDIRIQNNLLQLNNEKEGFNASARIRFYGPQECGSIPIITRNNQECTMPWCTDLEIIGSGGGLTKKNYTFNVSYLMTETGDFTNYSIRSTAELIDGVCQLRPGLVELMCEGEIDESIEPDEDGKLNVTNSIDCNASAIAITKRNVEIDFKGNELGFGINGSSDVYGIEQNSIGGENNQILRNFRITSIDYHGDSKFGMYLIGEGLNIENVVLTNFTISLNGSDGIVIGDGQNIQISDGLMGITHGASSFIIYDSENITINNVEINASRYDLNITDSQVNLVNQSAGNYTFTNANLTIENGEGAVEYLELVTEEGNNLSADIIIQDNLVYVNSILRPGLDARAEITLYDVGPIEGTPKIIKDGSVCTDCGPLVQNGNDFTFTVTGFSNYTISGDMFCGETVTNNSVLDQNMNCSGTGLIFGADNIFIDCQGFSIKYGNNGQDYMYGIHNPGYDNVTIRNCNISEGSNLGENKHGIYFNGSLIPDEDYSNSITEEIVENNRISTISDNSVPIKLFNIVSSEITNNTLISDGHGSGGIYISWMNSTEIRNNTINASSTDGFGISVYIDARNNYFGKNIINSAETAITMINPLDSGYILNNTFENNTLSGITGYDLELLDSAEDTHFIDQIIKEYYITEPHYLDFENTYGFVDFISRINGTGEKLIVDERIGDIRISQNEIYVNSSKSGLNKSAQLSFYNTGIYANARATRNNIACSPEYCSNVTQEEDDYTYNVTGFTTYGISSDGLCNDIITWSFNQSTNLVCEGNSWIIGADNIVIDCQGHNITYGNNSFGYGINNTGYENTTLKNCNIIEGYGDESGKHALYYYNASGSAIINNTILTLVSGFGLNAENSADMIVENNTININPDESYGIIADSADGIILRGNSINTYGEGYESTALKISESSGITAEYNDITTSGENAYGIHTYLIDYSELSSNTITTSDTGSITIYFESSDNSWIFNNSVEVANGASAIYIYGNSENNLVENNTVTQARRAVHLKGDYGDYPDNNTIRNNDFETITQRDIVVENGVTNLWLENQDVERYYIEDSDVNIRNQYGITDYLEQVSGTGDNFDADVYVENNNIGAKVSGFDKKARLTVYNVIIQGTAEAKLEGTKCPESICSALEIEGDDYTFNVTGFSNYSIGEMGINCGDTINSSAVMVYNLSCSEDGINIGKEGVVFNCMGHSISYGSSGEGIGVSVIGNDNVVIKNCTITDIAGGSEKYGIYAEDSDNMLIFNNSISTYSDESPAVYMLGSEYANVSENSIYAYFNHTEIFRFWNGSDSAIILGNELFGNKTFDIKDSNSTAWTDQDLKEYNIQDSSIIIKKEGIGRLEFIQAINGNGTDFSSEVIIERNLAESNSSKFGLNKSAYIELYDLDFNGTVIALRNNEECPDSVCSEVNYNDGTYNFSVTGFTNYSLAGQEVECGQTIYNTLHMNKSMDCEGTAVYIGADNAEIDCRGYSIDYGNENKGYAVSADQSNGFVLKNCIITEGEEGGHAVYVHSDEGSIYNNELMLSNENSSAVYINSSNGLYVWNNTLNSTDSNTYIIYILGSDSNELINNSITESGRGIKIDAADSNILTGNSLERIDNEELNISGSDYNLIRSNDFESYDLIESIVYFGNNKSRIEYDEEINQRGSNLSSDIEVNFNFVEVNASVSGLNKSAYLRFNNLPEITGYAIPVRNLENLGDGSDYWCPGDICTDFQKEGNNYSFHVSGFSNYSVYDMGAICGWELTGQMILSYDVSCGHVIVGSDYASLDCRGYSVTYGADNQGIWNIGYNNVEIKNCKLERAIGENGDVNVFYFENATNSLIENNTFENYGRPQTDIVINKSNMTLLSNQEARKYMLSESIIDFQNEDGKIEYSGTITQNGSNLSKDIQISYNSIYANSDRTGLSENADLSFYNLDIEGTAYAKRNGETCSGYCGPVTHSGDDYYFSVTGFSTYSIGDNTSQEEEEDNETSEDNEGANGVNFGGDYDAPEIGSPFPQGVIYETMPTMSIVTDEVATCKWDFKDRDYLRMDNEFQALGMIHTWSAVDKWDLGKYRIYARCMDANGNINGRSYSWTFEIQEMTSECGNGVCEYGEDENICPDDCRVILDSSSNGQNQEKDEEDENNLAGRAYSILELLKNTELGSWMVYILVLALFGAGYFISHHATRIAFGDKKNLVKFNLDDIKPEIALSAKKIKYQLMNDDIYNASLEYMNLKRLYMKIPSRYKEEKKYMYSYLIRIYEKIKKASEERNKNN